MNINEKTELEKIVPELDDDNYEQFRDMWYDDLQEVYHDKPSLLRAARSIVAYFGSQTKILDVDWDEAEHCLVWNVQLPVA